MKRYLMLASVLLLLFTVTAPHLGVSFAAANIVFFLIWSSLGKEKAGGRFWGQMLFGIILCNAVIVLYMGFGHGAPAEFCRDYEETLRAGLLMKTGMPAFLNEFLKNIRTEENAFFSVIFIAPVLTLFGGSFPVYILLLFNLFLVPFLMVMGLILYRMNPKSVPLVFLFAPFVKPVLRGSLDTAAFLYMAIWIFPVFKQTFRKKATKKAVLLGIVSFLLVLTKRWYLSFVLGAMLSTLFSLCVRRLFDKNYKVSERFINLGISAGVFLSLTVIILPASVSDMWMSLAGQSMDRIRQNMKMVYAYAGVLPVLCSLLGILGLWRRHFRQFTMFLLFCFVIPLFLVPLITAVEGACLFAPMLFLLAVIGAFSLPKWKNFGHILLYVAFCIDILCCF